MPAPLVVTVRAVDDLTPEAEGRHWTSEQYQQRDVILRALGVPTFGRGHDRS
jgi:hypothetical protein